MKGTIKKYQEKWSNEEKRKQGKEEEEDNTVMLKA